LLQIRIRPKVSSGLPSYDALLCTAARARKQNEATTLQVSGRLARIPLPNLRADESGLRKEPPPPRCICPRDRTPSHALLTCGPRAHVAATLRERIRSVPEWDIENSPARTTFLGRSPQGSPHFPIPDVRLTPAPALSTRTDTPSSWPPARAFAAQARSPSHVARVALTNPEALTL
jgi:hypothetical protein